MMCVRLDLNGRVCPSKLSPCMASHNFSWYLIYSYISLLMLRQTRGIREQRERHDNSDELSKIDKINQVTGRFVSPSFHSTEDSLGNHLDIEISFDNKFASLWDVFHILFSASPPWIVADMVRFVLLISSVSIFISISIPINNPSGVLSVALNITKQAGFNSMPMSFPRLEFDL